MATKMLLLTLLLFAGYLVGAVNRSNVSSAMALIIILEKLARRSPGGMRIRRT